MVRYPEYVPLQPRGFRSQVIKALDGQYGLDVKEKKSPQLVETGSYVVVDTYGCFSLAKGLVTGYMAMLQFIRCSTYQLSPNVPVVPLAEFSQTTHRYS